MHPVLAFHHMTFTLHAHYMHMDTILWLVIVASLRPTVPTDPPATTAPHDQLRARGAEASVRAPCRTLHAARAATIPPDEREREKRKRRATPSFFFFFFFLIKKKKKRKNFFFFNEKKKKKKTFFFFKEENIFFFGCLSQYCGPGPGVGGRQHTTSDWCRSPTAQTDSSGNDRDQRERAREREREREREIAQSVNRSNRNSNHLLLRNFLSCF